MQKSRGGEKRDFLKKETEIYICKKSERRERDGKEEGDWSLSLLWRECGGLGCGEAMEALLSSSISDDRKEVLLHFLF